MLTIELWKTIIEDELLESVVDLLFMSFSTIVTIILDLVLLPIEFLIGIIYLIILLISKIKN